MFSNSLFFVEPDIDRIAFFPELKSQHSVSYNTKQIIAREVEIEKMKRLDAVKSRNLPKGNVKKLSDGNVAKQSAIANAKKFVEGNGVKQMMVKTVSTSEHVSTFCKNISLCFKHANFESVNFFLQKENIICK